VWFAACVLALALLTGCAATGPGRSPVHRQFVFEKDTFAYPNELVWEYQYDANGKWTSHRRAYPPSYYQHCFVVSRSACQFFENAKFDPSLPKLDKDGYRRLVRRLVATNPRKPLAEDQKIIFPGYPDLRTFSREYEALLKAACGGAWQCYVQRGNWRMIFPFSRSQQERMAGKIQSELQSKGVAVVHLVRFPQLTINHAVLIFGAQAGPQSIAFMTYDPNAPEKPVVIRFDRELRTFFLPSNSYFPGGRVDVYPIYDRSNY
jgi:hypothetical protein